MWIRDISISKASHLHFVVFIYIVLRFSDHLYENLYVDSGGLSCRIFVNSLTFLPVLLSRFRSHLMNSSISLSQPKGSVALIIGMRADFPNRDSGAHEGGLSPMEKVVAKPESIAETLT